MRVNITIGDLQACCDHVWVNGMLYVPNTNLVFGGTEPVEVRFRSVAANVTGDITMEYRCATVAVVSKVVSLVACVQMRDGSRRSCAFDELR